MKTNFALPILITLLAMQNLSCHTGPRYHSSLFPVTEKLIKDHRLTPQELSQMRFYLTEDLTLTGRINLTIKKVNKNLGLLIYRGNDSEVIRLQRNTPGVAANIGYEPLLEIFGNPIFPGPLKITVCFSRYTDACLTFIPDKAGNYILETDNRKRVNFCGSLYRVSDNYRQASLCVEIKDAELRRKIREYQIPGRNTEIR
ncbi:MAG TPA: hypothetical protein PKN04_00180 [bacterium]|nr:hypothetical protein [bacterium]HNT64173.1 hypothetical protein [bacterium]